MRLKDTAQELTLLDMAQITFFQMFLNSERDEVRWIVPYNIYLWALGGLPNLSTLTLPG